MKKFFLIFLFFTATALSQVTYVDTLANLADTTYTLRLMAVYSWHTVTLENLGTGEDTLTAKIATFVKHPSTGVIVDTSWAVPWMKDNTGNDVTTLLVAQGGTAVFVILKPIVHGIEIALSNTTAGNTRVMIEAWKPD